MRYALPRPLLLQVALAALSGGRRSFLADSQAAVRTLESPPCVSGLERIPPGGCLLALNHYTRPGLGAWWPALALAAALPREAHCIMAGGWTYPPGLRRTVLEPLTAWAFGRTARVYGFTAMPPMPPRPFENALRAQAVRRVFAYARSRPDPLILLSPEGRDIPGGTLGWPPPGAGRFIGALHRLGLAVIPVGVCEEGGVLCLRLGPPLDLAACSQSSPAALDRAVSAAVMRAIAALLPEAMRGEFAPSPAAGGSTDP